ncbi:unnamed protein product [Pylaiella littoralis]
MMLGLSSKTCWYGASVGCICSHWALSSAAPSSHMSSLLHSFTAKVEPAEPASYNRAGSTLSRKSIFFRLGPSAAKMCAKGVIDRARGEGWFADPRGHPGLFHYLKELVTFALGVPLVQSKPATERAIEAAKSAPTPTSGDGITVKMTDDYLEFQPKKGGDGGAVGVIIIPGALVSPFAYSILARSLAQTGCPTFILRLPFNMAWYGWTTPGKIIKRPQEEGAPKAPTKWVLVGHSLGTQAVDQVRSRFGKIDTRASQPPTRESCILVHCYYCEHAVLLKAKARGFQGNRCFCIQQGRKDCRVQGRYRCVARGLASSQCQHRFRLLSPRSFACNWSIHLARPLLMARPFKTCKNDARTANDDNTEISDAPFVVYQEADDSRHVGDDVPQQTLAANNVIVAAAAAAAAAAAVATVPSSSLPKPGRNA